MDISSVDTLVGELRPLLEPSQLDEVSQSLQPRFSDPRALAGQLLKRGWLTPFQVNQLFLGRGEGLTLGPYILLERIGDSGLGQVFKARHRRMRRTVALVVITEELLDFPGAKDQFYAEVQEVSRLEHPNIVASYDAGPIGNTHFFAMEYVEGIDLARHIQEFGALSVEEACDCVQQVAAGLQHAHERGLLHHDLNPSNVLLVRPGAGRDDLSLDGPGRPLVKIRNLGLTFLRQPTRHSIRQTSAAVDSLPDYLAPEQAEAPILSDPCAQLYSLGCVFYFLLAARPPFAGGTAAEKLERHQRAEPPPLEIYRSDVPAGVSAVIHKLMAKDPGRRYQCAGEVVTALVPFVAGPASAPASDATRRLMPPPLFQTGVRSVALEDTVPMAEVADVARTTPRELPRWLWFNLIGGAVLLGSLAVFLALLFRSGPSPVPAERPITPEETARAELEKILPGGDAPVANPAELRQRLFRFRLAYPGTEAATTAAQVMAQLPSPLDALDNSQIPALERQPWQPRDALVAVLGEHAQPAVNGATVAVSPPNQLVLTRHNATLQVWHMVTGKMLATIKFPPTGFYSALIAPDGKSVALQTRDGILVYDVGSGQERTAVADRLLFGNTFAFAPDSQSLATISPQMKLKLWDITVNPAKETAAIPIGAQGYALAYAPDGKTLATVSQDRIVRTWDISESKMIAATPPVTFHIQGLAFTPNGKVVAAMGTDQAIRLWDTATGKELAVLRKAGFVPQAMMFSPDGQTLAVLAAEIAAQWRPTIVLWDPVHFEERAVLRRLPGATNQQHFLLGFSRNMQSLTTWGQEQTLHAWDLVAGQEQTIIKAYSTRVVAVASAPNCDIIAVGSPDGSIRLWEAGAAKFRSTLRGHMLGITGLAFSPDGQMLASASHDQTVRLWHVAGKTEKRTLNNPRGRVTSVAFSPDGQTLATGGSEQAVTLWDVATGTELTVLDAGRGAGGISSVAFAPDGRSLVGGGEDALIRVWSLAGGGPRRELKGHQGNISALAFHPQGAALASASRAEPNLRLSPYPGVPTQAGNTLNGHRGPVRGIAFAFDGRHLASVGEDGQVIVWKPDGSDKCQKWLFGGPVHGVVFAADGRHLITVNADGTAYILRTAPARTKTSP